MDNVDDILRKETGGPLIIRAPEETADDVALENMIEQYREDTRSVVKFYRAVRGEPDALLEEIPPSEFDFIRMARRYGRGNYRVKVYSPKEGELGKIRLTLCVNRTERYEGEIDQPQAISVTSANANNANDAMAQALLGMGQLMSQGFEQLGKLVVASNPKENSIADMLNNMVLMRRALGIEVGNGGGAAGMKEYVDMLRQGIDMGRDMSGGNSEDNVNSMLRLGEKVLPSLAEMASKAMDRRPVTVARPALAKPATVPIFNAADVESHTVDELGVHTITMKNGDAFTGPDGNTWTPATTVNMGGTVSQKTQQEEVGMFGINKYSPFKGQIAQLVDVVERNNTTDPYAYAIVLLDNLPEMAVDTILSDEKLVDNLADVDPRVNQHRKWFEDMALNLKELTTEEPGDTVLNHVPKPVLTLVGGSDKTS